MAGNEKNKMKISMNRELVRQWGGEKEKYDTELKKLTLILEPRSRHKKRESTNHEFLDHLLDVHRLWCRSCRPHIKIGKDESNTEGSNKNLSVGNTPNPQQYIVTQHVTPEQNPTKLHNTLEQQIPAQCYKLSKQIRYVKLQQNLFQLQPQAKQQVQTRQSHKIRPEVKTRAQLHSETHPTQDHQEHDHNAQQLQPDDQVQVQSEGNEQKKVIRVPRWKLFLKGGDKELGDANAVGKIRIKGVVPDALSGSGDLGPMAYGAELASRILGGEQHEGEDEDEDGVPETRMDTQARDAIFAGIAENYSYEVKDEPGSPSQHSSDFKTRTAHSGDTLLNIPSSVRGYFLEFARDSVVEVVRKKPKCTDPAAVAGDNKEQLKSKSISIKQSTTCADLHDESNKDSSDSSEGKCSVQGQKRKDFDPELPSTSGYTTQSHKRAQNTHNLQSEKSSQDKTEGRSDDDCDEHFDVNDFLCGGDLIKELAKEKLLLKNPVSSNRDDDNDVTGNDKRNCDLVLNSPLSRSETNKAKHMDYIGDNAVNCEINDYLCIGDFVKELAENSIKQQDGSQARRTGKRGSNEIHDKRENIPETGTAKLTEDLSTNENNVEGNEENREDEDIDGTNASNGDDDYGDEGCCHDDVEVAGDDFLDENLDADHGNDDIEDCDLAESGDGEEITDDEEYDDLEYKDEQQSLGLQAFRNCKHQPSFDMACMLMLKNMPKQQAKDVTGEINTAASSGKKVKIFKLQSRIAVPFDKSDESSKKDDENENNQARTERDDTSTDNLLSCLFCEYKCPNSFILNKHIQTHVPKTAGSMLTLNVKSKTPADKVSRLGWCDICNKLMLDIRVHKRAVHTKDSVLCTVCGKMVRFRCLSSHKLTHVNVDDEEKFECKQCSTLFKRKASLHRHTLIVHNSKKNHICKVCGKGFVTTPTLARHELIHSEEKPHKCEECGKGFVQRANLLNHRRQHTGQKPFKCDLCEEAFTHNVSLKNHKKKLHGIDWWQMHPKRQTAV